MPLSQPAVVAACGEAEDVCGVAADVTHAALRQRLQGAQMHTFRLEDAPLGFWADQAVISDIAVAAYYPMAGNEQRDGVARQCRADRPAGIWVANLSGNPAIGPDLAIGNLQR